jgi:anti-sigma regulatory factor (Ser/Thr protein kinase)
MVFSPVVVANLLHGFFRDNLPDVSYMTALICLHDLSRNEVQWISCGAPDLIVSEVGREEPIKTGSERRGGLPIGLLPDTLYTKADVVVETLSPNAVCIAVTDGVFDMSRDDEGFEKIPYDLLFRLRCELLQEARAYGAPIVDAFKFIEACREHDYKYLQDDVTILLFGPRTRIPDVFDLTLPLLPTAVDDAARSMGEWCRAQGWNEDDIGRVQLVLEEKLMNVYDHGFDDIDRLHEVACVRLLKRRHDSVELTVWDCGTPEPSIAVAAGSASTAFELVNQEMSNHGRGRLMVRELCDGIERKRFGTLNETVYHVRIGHNEEGRTE